MEVIAAIPCWHRTFPRWPTITLSISVEKLALKATAFSIKEIFADCTAAGVPDHVFHTRRELSSFLVIFFFFRGTVKVGAIFTSAPTILEIVAELNCFGCPFLSRGMLVDASIASVALVSQVVPADSALQITTTTTTLFRTDMAELACAATIAFSPQELPADPSSISFHDKHLKQKPEKRLNKLLQIQKM